jgi:predicted GNAT family N-acyltransferase
MRELVSPLRFAVFVVEQKVPEDLEWGDDDQTGFHVAAVDEDGSLVGCARVVRGDHIGRMAVRHDRRRQGVGAALLAYCEGHIRETGHTCALLNAQTHAQPFYSRQGYRVTSDIFMDAEIPHVRMEKSLTSGQDKPACRGLS